MADPVKRTYRSPARAAAAAETRARIRAAAADLFVQQGYVATTLRQAAKEADRDAIVTRYGLDANRVQVIPNYVDTAIFRPMPDVPREPGGR